MPGESPTIRSTKLVGRYAVGIEWRDGHDSILPLTHLRAHCPCERCDADRGREELPGGGQAQLVSLDRLGDASIFLRWNDGHETFYLLPELRSLCRCALCIGEPERPITG